MTGSTTAPIIYPDSDGARMADNTRQAEWILHLFSNLDDFLPEDFVAADLLWYPIKGDNKTRLAPDVLVAPGRPKGHRGSYQQWEESGAPPAVVFEILSPSNTASEMVNKSLWYDRFGVSEYYLYDPDRNEASGWIRSAATQRLEPIESLDGWTSPALGIRFALGESLQVFRPDGTPFHRFSQLRQERDVAVRERDAALETARRLAERLRELGIDPDTSPETE